ncbi:hypothetical protein SDRG_09442 [Saprolegnia diclina VS20]|uniref:PX domain-containing protein n=1 Tax=Saprolegnia diclina (strain VS20) TaxID=1156394 RepID=T0QDV4_SAPDV|nr:hypothetical protein SDRG_09442 [Saprolegnia diclina VS20]EQC32911.1 hypothetical protein SDRG_09442 [Saprolegnia diclina VS20]|eukprot:XP_008613597.1 hypothetical protein SDRG_09442 [Saprolegnia diclina VS20]
MDDRPSFAALRQVLYRRGQRSILDAVVVDSQVHDRYGAQVVEFHLRFRTKHHGDLLAWLDYYTLYDLSLTLRMRDAELPPLATKCFYLELNDTIQRLNAFLHAAVISQRVEWSLRVSPDLCLHKHLPFRCPVLRDGDPDDADNNNQDDDDASTTETDHIESSDVVDSTSTRMSLEPMAVEIAHCTILGSRVITGLGKAFVQYELYVATTSIDDPSFHVWTRYRSLRKFAARLQHQNPGLPKLPRRRLVGNLSSRTIASRIAQINGFLAAVVADDSLAWHMQLRADTIAYKHRGRARSAATATSE